jgi:antitoxin component of MazEF toxin-antitoxin module
MLLQRVKKITDMDVVIVPREMLDQMKVTTGDSIVFGTDGETITINRVHESTRRRDAIETLDQIEQRYPEDRVLATWVHWCKKSVELIE